MPDVSVKFILILYKLNHHKSKNMLIIIKLFKQFGMISIHKETVGLSISLKRSFGNNKTYSL